MISFYKLGGFVALLVLLSCQRISKNNRKIYFPRDTSGHIIVCTSYPHRGARFDFGDTLYITKNKERRWAYYVEKGEISRHVEVNYTKEVDITGEKCIRKQAYDTQKPFDTLIAKSVDLELMNFLLSYYEGNQDERIDKAYNTIANECVQENRTHRLYENDSLHKVLQNRYNNSQLDTMRLLRTNFLSNLTAYKKRKHRGHEANALLKEHTRVFILNYKRSFSLEDYCAFEENYAIMQYININIKQTDKIYTHSFGDKSYPPNSIHSPFEYTDVFTEYYFYKDNSGFLKVHERILNPSNINRVFD